MAIFTNGPQNDISQPISELVDRCSDHDRALVHLRSKSIEMQFFWQVDTRPISLFLFFFDYTFFLSIIIVIIHLM